MKKMILLLLIIAPVRLLAQEGVIIIEQDSGVQRVMGLYKTLVSEKRAVDGYRIQLISNNNRKEVLDMKARFMKFFPGVSSYLQYQQPQFKLRAGDFRSRADAADFLKEVQISFPSAFIVPDKIMVEGVEW